MEPLNERLLAAWLSISTAVVNSRIVSELPYKEALVCHELFKNLQNQQESPLTATALCRRTHMLKSQMNRTLKSLERKGLVVRERATKDRRRVLVRIEPQGTPAYAAQHQRVLELLDGIIDRLGQEESEQAVATLNRLAEVAAQQGLHNL